MVICACSLHPNPAKVPYFQCRAWLYSMGQKFHGDDEKTRESQFWDLVQCSTAIIRPNSQNSNIRHDGILSIGNFMLMINNHFARFQLPGKFLKTKKCAPYFRGNMEFPIYLFYIIYGMYWKWMYWFHLNHVSYRWKVIKREKKQNIFSVGHVPSPRPLTEICAPPTA
jgi:hypothetical protein